MNLDILARSLVIRPAATRYRNHIGLAVMLAGVFVTVMDGAIVNVAIPSIRTTLGATFAEAELVVAGYIFIFAIGIAGPHAYEQIPTLVDRSVLRVNNFFADLNERLEEVSFVAGEQFSAADITALVTIDFAKVLDLSVPEELRALTRWKRRFRRSPA